MSPLIPFRARAECDQCEECPQCGVNTCGDHGNGDRTTCIHAATCGECTMLNAVECPGCRFDRGAA